MSTHSFLVVASLPVLFAAAAPKHAKPELPSIARGSAAPDACALLTASEVSTALEVKSLPGAPPVQGSTKMCAWSDVPGNEIDHRRVVVSITSAAGFNFVKSRGAKITIEPISGIGDEAFYESAKSAESPFLFVRKGSAAFSVRILNGFKLKAFTLAEEKSKEAALAKAAVGRV